MAVPTFGATNSWTSTSTSSLEQLVPQPATVNAGDLLVCIIANNDARSSALGASTGAGWVLSGQAFYSTNIAGHLAYKIGATGGGSSDDDLYLTRSGSSAWSAIIVAISGADSIEFYDDTPTNLWANGSSADPAPPAFTPTGGTQDYLWLTGCCIDGSVVASAAPSGYSNFTTAQTGTVVSSALASKAGAASSSETPGTFTATTEQWVATTIAVWQASGASAVAGISRHYARMMNG